MKPEDVYWAIVMRPWLDEPVFHRVMEAQGRRYPDYVQCGRKIGSFTPWLPRKHVVKFARPCKDCFR